MRLIHIIDSAAPVNFGVWNAAISTAGTLAERGIVSELWFPKEEDPAEMPGVVQRPLESANLSHLQHLLDTTDLTPENTVVITHGCWRFPTRWGVYLKRKGFRWMAVPHGMLEPWSMRQKSWKKWVYFQLYERRALSQADAIRAVSSNEGRHLSYFFSKERLVFIPNGTEVGPLPEKPLAPPLQFLFLGRLHFKKGVLPLVEAWVSSELHNDHRFRLVVAGPDQGERIKIEQLLRNRGTHNVSLPGAVYGPQKELLLRRSHYFLLPSFSEGFPTAVLEAIRYGLIPLLSEGCNFPELFEKELAWRIEPSAHSILEGINQVIAWEDAKADALRAAAHQFLLEHYSLQVIGEKIAAWVDGRS